MAVLANTTMWQQNDYVTDVPEPSAVVLLLAAATTTAILRRRRRI